MGLKKSKQRIYEMADQDCFEDLSNELIYVIFDYMSFYDISHAFGNINHRLQNLIDSYPHYINLQQHKQDEHLILPRYIHSLRINARYQLALIDLSKIISLRNLILSNIPTLYILRLINTISLQDLEYVYLGVCFDDDRSEEQLKEIQEKILSLGTSKLKICVFRMRFLADIDRLPMELPSLEYLRIDGCKNILTVNKLLDRMINLRSLYVSILEQTSTNDYRIQQENNKHRCLTNVTIRFSHTDIAIEQLIPLFDRHGSRINNLTIKLSPSRQDRLDQFRQTMTSIINQSLPQLTHFQLRPLMPPQSFRPFEQYVYVPSSVEIVSSSFDHHSYRVSVAAHCKLL